MVDVEGAGEGILRLAAEEVVVAVVGGIVGVVEGGVGREEADGVVAGLEGAAEGVDLGGSP